MGRAPALSFPKKKKTGCPIWFAQYPLQKNSTEALFKLFPPIIAPLGRLKYDE
jgi:hypothetical protein